MEPIISVKNVSKRYKVFGRKKDVIVEAMFPRVRRHTYFTAVENISFDVYPGESVGIVGCNGAGKSTLLKMITGVVAPTEGTITLGGRVSSLLELGTAFNPELTGRENVYQHGQIFGLTNAEIKAREQEIIDFADIGDHIDQPVKTYSSGMFARLAFACAINVDPDILIVDEVLSVGDMAFQMKCFKKFEQFKERKKTILFVSHNTNDILTNCSRVMILQKGACIFDGDAKEGVERYKKLMSGVEMTQNKAAETKSPAQGGKMADSFERNEKLLVYGDGKADIVDYGVCDDADRPLSVMNNTDPVRIMFKVKFNEAVDDPIFALSIKSFKGVEVAGANTELYKVATGSFAAGETAVVEFRQSIPLAPDKYSLSFGCVKRQDNGELEILDRHYDAIFVDITSDRPSPGILDIKTEFSIRRNA
ncbi:MAG: ABC transporter ATP-binding protein [Clostridia bacterium]|nr:ABC transporter ATP-binding protein [Clostridia bacterium]